MKKKIGIIFLLIATLSFGEIRDNINIFSKETKSEIEKKITTFEKKNKIRIYLATSPYGEGVVLSDPTKTIIVNIQKNTLEGTLAIEESFSQDLNMEQYAEELDVIVESLKEYAETRDLKNYVIDFLTGVDELLSTIEEEKEEVDSEFSWSENKWKIIAWIGIILTFLNVIGRIIYISRIKKRKISVKK
ncbi:MAG: hypothetical protein ACRC6U_07815 [Fusobacteriaceae bacterium]